jgi:lipopolysaccharide biosynthesis regulator YciM
MRVNAKAQKNVKAEEQSLNILGELYLAKFDYTNAAIIYEDLLARSQARKNAYWEGIYLQKLAEIYSKSSEPSNAIRIKEQLVKRHIKDQKIELSHLIIEEMGDEHKASSVDTPLRSDAFDKTDDEKIAAIDFLTNTTANITEPEPYDPVSALNYTCFLCA